MKTYLYKAIHPQKKVIEGEMKAESVRDLLTSLRSRDYQIIEYRLKLLPGAIVRENKNKKLAEFCYGMSYLLASGIRLDEALDIYLGEAPASSFTSALERVSVGVQEGQSLSHACAHEPQFFDHIFNLLVEAGERSGTLSQCFKNLAQHYEQAQQLKEKIKKASRYPIFLMAIVFLAFGVIMNVLVPNLVSFLESMEQELSWTTKSLIVVSNFVSGQGIIFIVVIGFGGLALALLQQDSNRWQGCKVYIDRIPIWAKLVKAWRSFYFFDTLSVLTKNGIPLPEAVLIVQRVQKSSALNSIAVNLYEGLTIGNSLSSCMRASSLFTQSMCHIVSVGEKSGRVSDSFAYIANHQKTKLDSELAKIIGAIEPTMIVFIGGLLIWIVMGTIYPLYESFSQIHV